MRGFKEEFDAWRSSLSPEEQTMIQDQAEGEFNKKFRKSDEFKKDLPAEKVEAFTKILKKFFDAEAEDYKKEEDAKTPDYDGLTKKASANPKDFGLKPKIIEVDRDADRRYQFALSRITEAQSKGELWPQSSPMQETWVVKNDDARSHEMAVKVMDWIKAAAEDESADPKLKEEVAKLVKRGVPAQGEKLELLLPQALVQQIHVMIEILQDQLELVAADQTDEQWKELTEQKIPEIGGRVIGHLTEKYVMARDAIEEEVATMKEFYRSQESHKSEMEEKTKADVLKEIWEAAAEVTGKDLPPLDEEMLAELKEEPAIAEGEFMHNWGTADKLYKSVAIDAFGSKYLLGVFETKHEAAKAFEDWNAEFEKSRKEMTAELDQWGKQEQARLDRDTEGQERIKEVLENAKR